MEKEDINGSKHDALSVEGMDEVNDLLEDFGEDEEVLEIEECMDNIPMLIWPSRCPEPLGSSRCATQLPSH